MPDPSLYAPWLWLFTLLVTGRVIGQLIVRLYAPRWLPPFERWQSGLVSYPFLLACQAIVVVLMAWIAIDFTRGAGAWVQPMPALGTVVFWWSVLYVAAMAIRFIVWLARPRDEGRVLIPIVFHAIVAAFQFTFALFHRATP